jgi:transcription elongation GreA/GreB family factor
MAHGELSNEDFLRAHAAGGAPEVVLLPHEVALIDDENEVLRQKMERIIAEKISVSGGDDWHDGAFRATDAEAQQVTKAQGELARYAGATIVDYPAETERRASLGSRVAVEQYGYQLVIDLVGRRAGYPDGVFDAETEEEVVGMSLETPMAKAMLGQTEGTQITYKQGDRSRDALITRIDQSAVRAYFMQAAGVETAEVSTSDKSQEE